MQRSLRRRGRRVGGVGLGSAKLSSVGAASVSLTPLGAQTKRPVLFMRRHRELRFVSGSARFDVRIHDPLREALTALGSASLQSFKHRLGAAKVACVRARAEDAGDSLVVGRVEFAVASHVTVDFERAPTLEPHLEADLGEDAEKVDVVGFREAGSGGARGVALLAAAADRSVHVVDRQGLSRLKYAFHLVVNFPRHFLLVVHEQPAEEQERVIAARRREHRIWLAFEIGDGLAHGIDELLRLLFVHGLFFQRRDHR